MKLMGIRSFRLVAGVLGCTFALAAYTQTPATDFAKVHPPYRGVTPAKSDVIFSTRFTRPESLPLIREFGATRVEWVYTKDPGFAEALKEGGRWFGGTLNANGPLPDDDGYARDFDGKVLVAPWMKGWNGRWVTTTHPDTQRDFEEQTRRYIGFGARSLQFDDPQLQAFSALHQAGDFNEATLKGFPAWLAAYPNRSRVEFAGLAGFTGDYRQWLRDKHKVADADDYRKRLWSFPSTWLWIAYIRSTVSEHFIRLRRMAAEARGGPLPISMNLSLSVPVELNPHFFLARFADYIMAETHIDDWPQMVSHAATARSLGLGYVPSIMPKGTPENRVAIASLYALGGQPIVPWDVYVGNDEAGQAKRFFGTAADLGDLYRFVRANATLFDSKELAPQVGIAVPVAKGQSDQIRTLVRQLVSQGITFAFVPAGDGYQPDPQRLRHHAMLVLTNPEADYPADALEAFSRAGVRRISAPEAARFDWSQQRAYVVAPGAQRLRVIPRANPAQAGRLVVHLIDEARGQPGPVDLACQRRFGIRKAFVGRAVTGAAWHGPQGRVAVPVETGANEFLMTLPGCSLWGVLDLTLAQ